MRHRLEVHVAVASCRTFPVSVVHVHRDRSLRLRQAHALVALAPWMLAQVRRSPDPPVPVVLACRTDDLPLVLLTASAHHLVDAVVLCAYLHDNASRTGQRCDAAHVRSIASASSASTSC